MRGVRPAVLVVLLMGTPACGGVIDHFSGREEACRIIATGVPTTATIVRLIDTGASINDNPVVDFLLDVDGLDGTPYEAHSKALVSRLDVANVQPGRVVPVRVDPNDRKRVAIDLWDCEKK